MDFLQQSHKADHLNLLSFLGSLAPGDARSDIRPHYLPKPEEIPDQVAASVQTILDSALMAPLAVDQVSQFFCRDRDRKWWQVAAMFRSGERTVAYGLTNFNVNLKRGIVDIDGAKAARLLLRGGLDEHINQIRNSRKGRGELPLMSPFNLGHWKRAMEALGSAFASDAPPARYDLVEDFKVRDIRPGLHICVTADGYADAPEHSRARIIDCVRQLVLRIIEADKSGARKLRSFATFLDQQPPGGLDTFQIFGAPPALADTLRSDDSFLVLTLDSDGVVDSAGEEADGTGADEPAATPPAGQGMGSTAEDPGKDVPVAEGLPPVKSVKKVEAAPPSPPEPEIVFKALRKELAVPKDRSDAMRMLDEYFGSFPTEAQAGELSALLAYADERLRDDPECLPSVLALQALLIRRFPAPEIWRDDFRARMVLQVFADERAGVVDKAHFIGQCFYRLVDAHAERPAKLAGSESDEPSEIPLEQTLAASFLQEAEKVDRANPQLNPVCFALKVIGESDLRNSGLTQQAFDLLHQSFVDAGSVPLRILSRLLVTEIARWKAGKKAPDMQAFLGKYSDMWRALDQAEVQDFAVSMIAAEFGMDPAAITEGLRANGAPDTGTSDQDGSSGFSSFSYLQDIETNST